MLSRREAAGVRRSLLAAQEYLGAADARAVALVAERLAPGITAGASESVGGAVHVAGSASVPEALLDACEQAIADRHRLRIRYDGAHRGAATDRVIRPYHLHNAQGEWYVLGYCGARRDVRTFLLGRVRAPTGGDPGSGTSEGLGPPLCLLAGGAVGSVELPGGGE